MKYFRWMLGVTAVAGAIFAAQPVAKSVYFVEAPTITISASRVATLYHEPSPITVTAQRAVARPTRT